MRTIIAATAFLFSATMGQALTVTEMADFANQGTAGPLTHAASPFNFSVAGVHSINGSLDAVCDAFNGTCQGGDFSDSMSIVLDAGFALTSVVFTVFDTVASFGSAPSPAAGVTFETNETVGTTAWTIQSIAGNGSADFTNSFTNVPENGVFSFGIGVNGIPFPTDTVSASWRIDIGVEERGPAPVPLPATGLLLLGALGGLGAVKRKRRRSI